MRAGVLTFPSYVDSGDTADRTWLGSLDLDYCGYGGIDARIYPFICRLPRLSRPVTGRDIVHALKVREFRSDHTPTLDATYLPYPGYHAYTANEEVHNDFRHQYVFPREAEIDEMAGVHGEVKRYVIAQHLWYVLLKYKATRARETTSFRYALLFAVGQSPRGHRCVGVVTHQMCHNLCD